jgi:hypothetical protein
MTCSKVRQIQKMFLCFWMVPSYRRIATTEPSLPERFLPVLVKIPALTLFSEKGSGKTDKDFS